MYLAVRCRTCGAWKILYTKLLNTRYYMAKLRQFLRMNKASGNTQAMALQSTQAAPLWILYPNINQLPLNIFIDCLVDHAYEKLIVTSRVHVPRSVLVDQWRILQGEYNDALGSIEHKAQFVLQKAIILLEIDINQLRVPLEMLRRFKDQFLCDHINEVLDTDFEFDFDNIDSYLRDVNKATARMGTLELRLSVKQEQMNAILGRNDKEGNPKPEVKATQEHFTNMLIELSDHGKYRIDRTIMTDEFCLRIKRHNAAAERANANKK